MEIGNQTLSFRLALRLQEEDALIRKWGFVASFLVCLDLDLMRWMRYRTVQRRRRVEVIETRNV